MSKRRNAPEAAAPEAAEPQAPVEVNEARADARPDVKPDAQKEESQPLEGKDFAYHGRAAMLKEIAKSAAEREETTEGDIGVDENGNEVFIAAKADDEQAAAPEAGTAGEGDAAPAPTGEGEGTPAPEALDETKFRRLVINGEEKIVPIEDIVKSGIAAYQKQSAADANLGLAAQILEQARQIQQPQPQQRQQPQQAAMDSLIVETAKRIQYGTPEDATQALQEFRDTIARDVSQRVASESRTHTVAIIDQREAARKFGNDYPDVVSDPNLLELAFTMEDRMRQRGDQRPWGVVYSEIGKELRTRYVPKEKWPTATQPGAAASPQGQASATGLTPSQQRVTRKEGATAAVAGQGGGAPPAAAPKPLTPSQSIAKIAKARGQAID